MEMADSHEMQSRGESKMQTLEKHGHAGWQPKDAEIEHAIINALARHPRVKVEDLRILVKDRKVTLSGKAANQQQIEQVGSIASEVTGVRELDNQLGLV
jgi:osmotically-inducible protein OsmY